IFDMQRGLTGVDQLPRQTLVRLQSADKVVLAELFDIQTQLSTDEAAIARLEAENELMRQFVTPDAVERWFSAAAVAQRVGYVAPETTQHEDHDEQAPPPPRNPFMP